MCSMMHGNWACTCSSQLVGAVHQHMHVLWHMVHKVRASMFLCGTRSHHACRVCSGCCTAHGSLLPASSVSVCQCDCRLSSYCPGPCQPRNLLPAWMFFFAL